MYVTRSPAEGSLHHLAAVNETIPISASWGSTSYSALCYIINAFSNNQLFKVQYSLHLAISLCTLLTQKSVFKTGVNVASVGTKSDIFQISRRSQDVMVNLIRSKLDMDNCLRKEDHSVCQHLKVQNCALCSLKNSVEYSSSNVFLCFIIQCISLLTDNLIKKEVSVLENRERMYKMNYMTVLSFRALPFRILWDVPFLVALHGVCC